MSEPKKKRGPYGLKKLQGLENKFEEVELITISPPALEDKSETDKDEGQSTSFLSAPAQDNSSCTFSATSCMDTDSSLEDFENSEGYGEFCSVENTDNFDGSLTSSQYLKEQIGLSEIEINRAVQVQTLGANEEDIYWYEAMEDVKYHQLVLAEDAVTEESEQWFDANESFHDGESFQELYSSVSFAEESDSMQDISHHDANEHSTTSDNEYIFSGSAMTIGAFMLLFSAFITRYNLTGDAVCDFLTFLTLAFPQQSKICRSLSEYKAYFKHLKNPIVFHYYCSFCMSEVTDKNAKNCSSQYCGQPLEGNRSYFLEISLEGQIKTFFKREGFLQNIQHRFQRKKKAADNIEDIFDGNLYKDLSKEGGFLNSKFNISLTFNTDGVPVFKSSKVSMWPIFYIINELPYASRMRKENMLFGGLWFGEKKPVMWTYLKPQYEMLHKLETDGIHIDLKSSGGPAFICRVALLCAVCDLPARSLVVNSIQFNGKFSCWKCLQPGETTKTGPKGHVHTFPFQQSDPKGPKRTRENALNDAKDAVSKQLKDMKIIHVNGIKGPSWLSFLQHFDYIIGTGIDYMHGVLLGVQKVLLNLWFSKANSGKPYNIFKELTTIDARLAEIKPTSTIKRLPRSISEHLKYWKANEYRSFLLFWGLPVLNGILPTVYYNHYTLLVCAIYLLLKESICEEDVETAERMLFSFYQHFSELYDQRYCTLNLHQLIHLADDVRDLGPLFTHSLFHFEDKNGLILGFIKGTQSIDSQIVNAVSMTQKLPELLHSYIQEGSKEEALFLSMQLSSKPKRTKTLEESIYLLGSMYQQTILSDEHTALVTYLGYMPVETKFMCFNRIELRRQMIYGKRYKRLLNRNNATVKYSAAGATAFANVEFFMKYSEHIIAICKPFTFGDYDTGQPITRVKLVDNIIAIDVNAITKVCIYICFTGQSFGFICEFPNDVEND